MDLSDGEDPPSTPPFFQKRSVSTLNEDQASSVDDVDDIPMSNEGRRVDDTPGWSHTGE